jgi:hypothetical protein
VFGLANVNAVRYGLKVLSRVQVRVYPRNSVPKVIFLLLFLGTLAKKNEKGFIMALRPHDTTLLPLRGF